MKTLYLKWIVISGLFLSQTLTAQALESIKKQSPEEWAATNTNELKNELNLSESQTKKVQVINLDFAKKATPIIKNENKKFALARKLKPLNDKRDKEFEKVLNKNQFKLFKSNKKMKLSKLRNERNA